MGVLLDNDRAKELLEFERQRRTQSLSRKPHRGGDRITARPVHWVRVSSTTLNADGFYPGFMVFYDASTNTWIDDAAVQIAGGNGETLAVQRYLAEMFGDYHNLPVYGATVGGSSSIPFHGAQLARSSTQSIPNNTATLVTWNSFLLDTDGYLNSNQIIIPTGLDGYYAIGATISWEYNTTGSRRIYVGSGLGGSVGGGDNRDTVKDAGTIFGPIQTVSGISHFTAGTQINVTVIQDSGGALNVMSNANTTPTMLWAYRIGV